jgi:hypothetical protein
MCQRLWRGARSQGRTYYGGKALIARPIPAVTCRVQANAARFLRLLQAAWIEREMPVDFVE